MEYVDKKEFMKDQLKFVIIGTGRVARNHAKAIKENVDCELEGVYDIVSGKAEQFVKDHELLNTKVYEKLFDVFDNKDVNVVCICTPPSTHFKIACACVRAGKHCIIEKPVTLNMQEAKELKQLCEQHKKSKVTVCHQYRFNPTLQKLKSALEEGKLGTPLFARADILWNRGQEYYDQEDWYNKNESIDGNLLGFGGGTLMNQAVHNVDLLLWLNGPIQKVRCYGGTLNHDIEVDDLAVASFEFENGSYGNLMVTTNVQPKNYESNLVVGGDEGFCKIGGVWLNKLEAWNVPEDLDGEENVNEEETTYGNGHALVIADMINSIRLNKQPSISLDDGILALQTVLAMYKSMQKDREVVLDGSETL